MDEAKLQRELDTMERTREALVIVKAELQSLRADVPKPAPDTAALATARREGAEEMRERCDDALTARLVEALREVNEKQYRGTGAERDVVGAVRYTIDEIRDAIRALPLDAPGGGA